MTYQKRINLSETIGKPFFQVHNDIKEGNHTHYWFAGGRGSLKSSFASIEIVLGINADINANAICYRKVADTLRNSVYEQIAWAIKMLGQQDLWRGTFQPLEFTYKPTGQKILFKGLDKAKKSKSIKISKGYFKILWFEELDEFEGMDEIRSVRQSVLRGGDKFITFMTYNPPKSLNNWVNQEDLNEREDTYKHRSTYLDVPQEWLGKEFITEAEETKKTNQKKYEHEYMGVAIGNGGKVFDNITVRPITNEEIEEFDKVKQGLDLGFAADPCAYVKVHYERHSKRLFIYDELYQWALSNTNLAIALKKKNPLNKYIRTDVDPRTINDLNGKGVNLIQAKKGEDSIDIGVHYLSVEILEIVIDPKRCPNTAKEFTSYELEQDKNGNFKSCYPDKDNHAIDATRYALNEEIMFTKATIKSKARYGFS